MTFGEPSNGTGRATRTPRVGIGVPVYNGERFLEQALNSLLEQSFEDFELIISDNASTDGTEEICRSAAARDSRVKYLRLGENIGAHPNFNRAFHLSSSEYFKWAAYDDICKPEFLERCVEVLDEDASAILCYPKTSVIDVQGRVKRHAERSLEELRPDPSERFGRVLKDASNWCYPTFGVIRSNVLARTSLMRSFLRPDYALLCELSLYGGFREVPDFLFLNRDHPRNVRDRYGGSLTQRVTWCDPRRSKRIPLITWWIFAGLLDSIAHAPLTRGQRARCYLRMGSWVRTNGTTLVADFPRAGRELMARRRNGQVPA